MLIERAGTGSAVFAPHADFVRPLAQLQSQLASVRKFSRRAYVPRKESTLGTIYAAV